jgi:hypothetical protein
MRRHVAGLSSRRAAFWVLCGLASPALAVGGAAVNIAVADSAADRHSPADPLDSLDPVTVATTTAATTATTAVIDFDIPAQALTTALDRFSVLSGRSALFSSAMVAERLSSPLSGRYTPLAGLQLMLKGTGLAAEEVRDGRLATFILKQADPRESANAVTAPSSLDDYDGLIQARVWQGICADSRTASGSYRSLLRFQVDPAGRISRPRLLGSSGDRRRDSALIEVLQGIWVGQPPPADMIQPVSMLILPEQAGGPVCSNGSH